MAAVTSRRPPRGADERDIDGRALESIERGGEPPPRLGWE
jgi:hypothetical protein